MPEYSSASVLSSRLDLAVSEGQGLFSSASCRIELILCRRSLPSIIVRVGLYGRHVQWAFSQHDPGSDLNNGRRLSRNAKPRLSLMTSSGDPSTPTEPIEPIIGACTEVNRPCHFTPFSGPTKSHPRCSEVSTNLLSRAPSRAWRCMHVTLFSHAAGFTDYGSGGETLQPVYSPASRPSRSQHARQQGRDGPTGSDHGRKRARHGCPLSIPSRAAASRIRRGKAEASAGEPAMHRKLPF
jgi:hypothetical protein